MKLWFVISYHSDIHPITNCLEADLQIPKPPKSTLLWHWPSRTVSTEYLFMPCNTAQDQLIWWIFTSVSVKSRYAYEILKRGYIDEEEKTDWKWVRSRERDLHLIEKKQVWEL